jgi:hypothetical protein
LFSSGWQRPAAAAIVAMPKTAMDEYDCVFSSVFTKQLSKALKVIGKSVKVDFAGRIQPISITLSQDKPRQACEMERSVYEAPAKLSSSFDLHLRV